jgi:hypothetical protein
LQNTSTATTVYPTFSTSSANGNSSAVINTSISANLGHASITATTFVGALSGAATSATTAGTVTTAAQPNITSVGTLTSVAVTGNVTAGNVYANSGTIGASLLTGTLTTNAQPNITSTGTLTSLTVSGNITAQANVNMSGYVIRSVETGIIALGITQGTAVALTKEINVVSTVVPLLNTGVKLPVAVPGMVITIINTSGNTLSVWPNTGADINGGTANAAYSHSAGATLQYVTPNTTDWYTVGATFA